MQILPEELTTLWMEWGIRFAIFLSLCLQFTLAIFGPRRKYIAKSWIKILVWSAYVIADWLPTYALGVLFGYQGVSGDAKCSTSNKFQTFWASILLLHLGGPDSITAYSLEDNDLWLRHFLGFVVQVGVIVYLFLNSWSNNALAYMSLPLILLGIIRYGERTFVLRSSSTKRFKHSLLSNPDPSPEFIKVMELNIVEEMEKDSVQQLIEAHFLFKRFGNLYAELILGYGEEILSYNMLHQKSANEAFSLVAIELGFMFDILYTKATTVFSRVGIFLRCISFLTFVSALVFFSIFIRMDEYPTVDISISYSLLAGTIALELYSFKLFLFSDWAKLRLPKLRKLQTPRICKAPIRSFLRNQKRWSESMGQFNLVSICLKEISATCIGVEKLLRVDKLLDKYRNLTWKEADVDLQNLIYQRLLQKSDNSQMNLFEYDMSRRKILAYRGENVLETRIGDAKNLHPRSKLCKYLSDYMLYLLLFCPSMMPKGFGESRYKATCEEAMKFFESKQDEISNSKIEACRLLLESKDDQLLLANRVGSHLSTLFYGCKIARQLQALEGDNSWSNEQKWEMISEFWVEMLAYAAIECGWREHGQNLRKGGELLTHVCVLMAHLGFSKQYRIYGRDI
ncbi:DUF594 family protein [Melia azedarach]|uniref:DUF594 family protein n=1 Tax=Melia azedarach TaxID=155640 RepID=A0ACC1Y0R0_MELAZ|nr:DUF594 family protein [Melia azedarach]